MTRNKTVFVLGAGASYEFGLPVGDTLKEQISKLLSYKEDDFGNLSGGDATISNALRYLSQANGGDGRAAPYFNAAKIISNALPLAFSIDNFLHNHNHDEHVKACGKLGIVRSILKAEQSSKLYDADGGMIQFDKCKETWAVRFMRLITEQCPLADLPDRLAKLVFIVFNYDRCLEHFLAHALKLSYGISMEQACGIVDDMEIYHPYGTVGNLPWMSKHKGREISFGGSPNTGNLLELAKEIKTFTESTDIHESDILAIRGSIQNAERMIFLGYAYHPLNMNLLIGDSPRSNVTRRVFGTAYGMSASDTTTIRDYLDNTLFAPSAKVRNDVTCFNIFHEYSRSLGFT
jgi:hypothetical protein